jgi:hypothetical protein
VIGFYLIATCYKLLDRLIVWLNTIEMEHVFSEKDAHAITGGSIAGTCREDAGA